MANTITGKIHRVYPVSYTHLKRVDGVEIKEDTYYKLVNGVFTEVDE